MHKLFKLSDEGNNKLVEIVDNEIYKALDDLFNEVSKIPSFYNVNNTEPTYQEVFSKVMSIIWLKRKQFEHKK